MLKGKVAIVTGSTSGIGLATARALAADGADVMINGFGDADAIEKLREGMAKECGVRVAYDGADMSKPAEITRMVENATRTLGKVDILVSNAGIQHTAPIEDFPAEKWDAIIAINLSATFHAIHAAMPQMKQRNWGRIINIASVHGLVASAQKVAYVAAKHGIVGFTKVTALETAGQGITANAVCPGFVLTPLVEKQIEDLMTETGESREKVVADRILQKQPSKQFATVEEIGGTVAFLTSDDAAQITGTTISVDGGWTAQ